PERPFDRERFLAAVKAAHDEHGFVSIVCGEGITYADGTPVSASRVTDTFANVEFGAMGGTSAAMMLHRMIGETFGWRGEFQITESLQMSADDRSLKLDHAEAYACGRQAVKLALTGKNGVMVTVLRASKPGRPYRAAFGTIPLKEVAVHARPMDDRLISANGMDVTRAFIDYARPLVGELPAYASLNLAKAKPAKLAKPAAKPKSARGSRA
ncbi:MAG: phosphofructokinase, partial [Planctomycetes bacterium]|nr:phosphofructokinase [Planctomycetota bacterium]